MEKLRIHQGCEVDSSRIGEGSVESAPIIPAPHTSIGDSKMGFEQGKKQFSPRFTALQKTTTRNSNSLCL